MKRLLIFALVVVACGGVPKATVTPQARCPESAGMTWRYDHTEYWTTSEAIYGNSTYIDFETGELRTKYGVTGYKTVQHSREVYDCLPRR